MESIRKRTIVRIVLAVCIFLLTGAAFADNGTSSITASLAWNLDLRGCYEYRSAGPLGFRAGIGTTLLLPAFLMDGTVMLAQEALGIIHFTPSHTPFQAGIGIGIPVSGMIWYRNETTAERAFSILFAPGCSFYLGYRSPAGRTFRVWLGAGYPIVFDDGDWSSGTNSFLDLWWDFDLEVVFPLR